MAPRRPPIRLPYTVPFVLTTSASVQAIATEAGRSQQRRGERQFHQQLRHWQWHRTARCLLFQPVQNICNDPATLVRMDTNINFNWGTGSPDPSISADNFTVRWTGSVQPQFNETYTFYTTTDDGVRLWVNGQLLIDEWVDQSATTYKRFHHPQRPAALQHPDGLL